MRSDESTAHELPRELTRSWQRRGIDPAQLSLEPSGSLAPPPGFDEDETYTDTEIDPPPPVDPGPGATSGLLIGPVLGEGGNGVVRLASQPALARDVAVKILNAKTDNPKARQRLLREARATGALEHPNIVPVHDITTDAEGRPMIVMKRIEGTAWVRRLHERPSHRDPAWLEEHLRVLIQVARAVHFAHEKRVLHRDLKPENVMLGAHGEIYVVDWGIAAALDGCRVPGLPLAREVRHVFGTPAYMPPEMVIADGAQLGPKSDVYLLGAILYRVVMGRPPHRADTVAQTLTRAFKSLPPRFADDVPERLQAVCRQAMAREVDERTPDAATLADELEAYLRHRHSLALSREGQARLDELRALLDAGAEPHPSQLAARYRECRFAFEQARRIWPQNPKAAVGLAEAAERLAENELALGRPDAARALLEDLEAPSEPLTARVSEALAERARRAEALERMAADQDITRGDPIRSLGAALLVVGSVTLNLVCAWLSKSGRLPIGHREYAIGHGLNFLWGLVIVALLRRGLWANLANRRVTLTSFFSVLSHVLVMTVTGLLGVPFADSMVLMALTFGLIWTVGAFAFDRRMVAVPLFAFIEAPLMAKWPGFAFEIMAAGVTVSLLLTGAIWARPRPRRRA